MFNDGLFAPGLCTSAQGISFWKMFFLASPSTFSRNNFSHSSPNFTPIDLEHPAQTSYTHAPPPRVCYAYHLCGTCCRILLNLNCTLLAAREHDFNTQQICIECLLSTVLGSRRWTKQAWAHGSYGICSLLCIQSAYYIKQIFVSHSNKFLSLWFVFVFSLIPALHTAIISHYKTC